MPPPGVPCAARWALAACLLSPGAAWSDGPDPDDVPCEHGYAFLSEPKYPPDFEHFDWVNPDAPKGGLIRVPDMGNWDNFNSMALGRMVRGMNTRGGRARHLYDSLAIRAPDEVATVYALLAECIAVPPDGAWIEFRLRDGAYWHDGETIDARDVTFSFEVYKEKANPTVAAVVVPFSRVEVLDGNRIRYHILPEHRYNRLLPIRIGEMPVMAEHYWTAEGNDAGKSTVRPPLGSGPYRIADYDIGRWIEWRRDPDYWGRDLPVNRGRYNFDRVKYDYFRDDQMQTEAVKGNAVDIHVENVPRRWATAYDFPPVDAGLFKLEFLPRSKPAGLWWPIFWNLDQPRFQDIRVREALWLLNDFKWGNRRGGTASSTWRPASSTNPTWRRRGCRTNGNSRSSNRFATSCRHGSSRSPTHRRRTRAPAGTATTSSARPNSSAKRAGWCRTTAWCTSARASRSSSASSPSRRPSAARSSLTRVC